MIPASGDVTYVTARSQCPRRSDVPLEVAGVVAGRVRASICVVPRVRAGLDVIPEQRLARLRHRVDIDELRIGAGALRAGRTCRSGGACWAGRAGVTRRADRPVGACRSSRPAGPALPAPPAPPVAPAGPTGPIVPVVPVGPAGPTAPVLPAGPIGPAEPGAPICPLRSCRTRCAGCARSRRPARSKPGSVRSHRAARAFLRVAASTRRRLRRVCISGLLAKPAIWPATAGVLLATSATTRATMSVGVRAPVVLVMAAP